MRGALSLDALTRVADGGLVVRVPASEAGAGRAMAWVGGGATALAMTHDGDGTRAVLQSLRAILALEAPRVLVGVDVGEDMAALADHLDDGVDFVVGAATAENLVIACRRARVAYFPDCAGADEVDAAELAGAELCFVRDGTGLEEPGRIAAARPRSRLFVSMPAGTAGDLAARLANGIDGVVLDAGSAAGDAAAASSIVWTIRRARGWPLYGAVEHVGLYPRAGVADSELAGWYSAAFDYPTVSGNTIFVGAGVFGRIEVMRTPADAPAHIAVRVWDFDAAVDDLRSRGYRLEPPVISATSKMAYFSDRDPIGNLVHIIWRSTP